MPPLLPDWMKARCTCLCHLQNLSFCPQGLAPPTVVSPSHPCRLCAAVWGTGWFMDAGDIIELSGNSYVFMAVTMMVFKELH